MVLPKNQTGFTPIIIIAFVVAIIVSGVGGFLLYTNLSKPAQIREKSTLVQPLYTDFKRSMEDIADHMNETPSGSDADSSERYSQKGKGLVKDATEKLESLKTELNKLNLPETDDFKKTIEEYIAKAEELIQYENDEIKLSQDYDTPKRDYETLTKNLAGVSNYIYSDPARYVKEVGNAIEKEDEIIADLEGLEVEGLYKKYHDVYIKFVKLERDFLQNVKIAVQDRDDTAFTDASKKYAQDSQDVTKELLRVSDEVKEKWKGAISDLKSLSDRVDQAYNGLKNKFNF